MYRHMLSRGRCAMALLLGLAIETRAARPAPARVAPPRTSQAWTYAEAVAQLALYPDDVYLQYVALQLGREAGKLDEVSALIAGPTPWRQNTEPHRADLFDLFSGAAAVQESLQLDTLRGQAPAGMELLANPANSTVGLAELGGPGVQSHPWGKMLAAQSLGGRRVEVSPLALCVPEDQSFVLFRSLTKLVEASEAGDLWGDHLVAEASQTAISQDVGQRLKAQLAVRTDPLSRPFYDMVVEEVALTGSDLYFREGTDVTVLFALKQPDVFRARMDGFLAEAAKSRPDAVRSTGQALGVEYVEVSTPDRAIHVFSAYPRPNLHLRSNSKAGLERVLEAVAGKRADGVPVARLGEATEYKYIRTLLPPGAQEEDGFVYLSDPFIRRLVGPEVKLTERRRMLCYNHLRMIGHASMLFRTQFGRAPASFEELSATGCAPGVFGAGKLLCPDGGRYSLSADRAYGVCSHHGHAAYLVPCREIPVARVTPPEAAEYRRFVEDYSRYWRQYFDPIAIRLQIGPKRYRVETIILPLIDNSVYTSLASALGGEPQALDTLPVPERNIFSVAVHANKSMVPMHLLGDPSFRREVLGMSGANLPDENAVREFLTRGIGDQVSLHVYDCSPMFDFSLTQFLGMMVQSFRGGTRGSINDEIPMFAFLGASLNSPVYAAVPVKDAEIVDRFLDGADNLLAAVARQRAQNTFVPFKQDFYKFRLVDKQQGPLARCFNLSVGPVRWRLFFARIGDGLYIASKPYILEDLAAAQTQRQAALAAGRKPEPARAAHAMIRIRPEHWKAVLPEYKLGWEESHRQACLNNLGPLSSVARATAASGTQATPEQVQRLAADLHAAHFFCPDAGRYELAPDGKQMVCSVHGSAQAPRQLSAPAPQSAMSRLLKEFAGATAELTFLEDGLHAVITIDRK